MEEKSIYFIGSSFKDFQGFPQSVQEVMIMALRFAAKGNRHPKAKPLKGFGGTSVWEIVEVFKRDTYRVVYTIRFFNRIYVLHSYKKKSKQGIKTPHLDVELIENRLVSAQRHYENGEE